MPSPTGSGPVTGPRDGRPRGGAVGQEGALRGDQAQDQRADRQARQRGAPRSPTTARSNSRYSGSAAGHPVPAAPAPAMVRSSAPDGRRRLPAQPRAERRPATTFVDAAVRRVTGGMRMPAPPNDAANRSEVKGLARMETDQCCGSIS